MTEKWIYLPAEILINNTMADEPLKIDFGTGEEERWHHPELGKQYLDEMMMEIAKSKTLFGGASP